MNVMKERREEGEEKKAVPASMRRMGKRTIWMTTSCSKLSGKQAISSKEQISMIKKNIGAAAEAIACKGTHTTVASPSAAEFLRLSRNVATQRGDVRH
jgi:hypothetical protein